MHTCRRLVQSKTITPDFTKMNDSTATRCVCKANTNGTLRNKQTGTILESVSGSASRMGSFLTVHRRSHGIKFSAPQHADIAEAAFSFKAARHQTAHLRAHRPWIPGQAGHEGVRVIIRKQAARQVHIVQRADLNVWRLQALGPQSLESIEEGPKEIQLRI